MEDWSKVVDVVYRAAENKYGGFLTTLAKTLGVNGLYEVSNEIISYHCV